MLDQIQKEINGFYTKYARAEGITLTEAKKKVAKTDIEAYERKAAKYVKEEDFSQQANEEMRLYNATMKINRLELLKANIGLELVDGFDGLQKYYEQTLTERTLAEFKRQAGILGATVQDNASAAAAIVNASFQSATFSERVWTHQGMMKAELDNLLRTMLIQGKNSRQMASHLERLFGQSKYNAERLLITELARVQTEAQKLSFQENGYGEYEFIAVGDSKTCEVCEALDGEHFKVKDMMPGENAPPMHPFCRCSTAAYMDDEEFEKWLEKQGRKELEDVTREYLDKATPGKGTIIYDDRIRDEDKAITEWLYNKFGGNIHALKDVNKQNVKTPDAYWNGKYWEYKNPKTENAIDKRLKDAVAQLADKEGGIVVDLTGCKLTHEDSMDTIIRRLSRRLKNSTDVIVKDENSLLSILRYTKKE